MIRHTLLYPYPDFSQLMRLIEQQLRDTSYPSVVHSRAPLDTSCSARVIDSRVNGNKQTWLGNMIRLDYYLVPKAHDRRGAS